MPSLIVIRIVPQAAIDPNKFTSEYLDPPGLGPLQITAFDLSFNSPTAGQAVGTASYIGAASTAPNPTSSQPANVSPVFLPPQYSPDRQPVLSNNTICGLRQTPSRRLSLASLPSPPQ